MKRIAGFALVCAALLVAACRQANDAPAGAQPAAPVAAAETAHKSGREIYNFRCYYCHGYSGDAQTLAARFVSPPPRSFQQADPKLLSREAMIAAVRGGRAGTAMAAFGGTLGEREIEAVVDFVRDEFMVRKAVNTRYHTAENGWPEHTRYSAAFPFATGSIPLDRPWEDLNAEQAAGKRLYLSACISCHDRSHVIRLGEPWALRGVSYPPGNYEEDDGHDDPAGAHAHDENDPYEKHEEPPKLANLSAHERLGERLFQANCAYCHAPDGTGRNWIGSFLEPPPADFTAAETRARLNRGDVAAVTREGRSNTSMPAWKAVLAARQIDAIAAYVERAWGPRSTAPQRTAARSLR